MSPLGFFVPLLFIYKIENFTALHHREDVGINMLKTMRCSYVVAIKLE